MMKLLLLIFSMSLFAFDHSHKSFDEVLQKRVKFNDHQSLVDYEGLKSDSEKLESYLKSLSSVNEDDYEDFSGDEKLSFLINAYNAFTLKLIIDNYPVDSIKDLGGLFSSPWKKEFFKLLGKDMDLDTIEHGMIRENFEESRIHFAVNCASISCPSLASNAFVANKLDKQLEKAKMNFLKNKDKNYIKGKTLYVSKIFDWYGKDFKSEGGAKAYILKALGLSGKYKLRFLDYNWDLNKQ